VQVNQHSAIHHADFVDNKIMTIGPVVPFGLIYVFFYLFPNWKIGSAMKGTACDIESSRAGDGGNHQLVLSIEHSKPGANRSYQTAFSSASFSKYS
jgi:hypothetical protein